MTTIAPGGIDPGLMVQYAEASQARGAIEDKKTAGAAKDSALDDEINAGKVAIKNQRKMAAERLKAGQKKANGALGGMGTAAGIALIVVVLAVLVATSVLPGGQAIAALLIALAPVILGIGAPVGSASGDRAGKKNEERAIKAQAEADRQKLREKEAAKAFEEWNDAGDSANEMYDRVVEDQRERTREGAQANARIFG